MSELGANWPVHTPQAVAEIGTMHLKPGDILVDLRKRKLHPEASWSYTLIALGPGDRTMIGVAKGWDYTWNAIYGPGKMGGRQTSISPPRLVRLHRIGNVTETPFKIEYPKDEETNV